MEHFPEKKIEDNANRVDVAYPAGRPKIKILSVLWRIVVTIGIIAGAFLLAKSWISGKDEPVQRQARERSFTISVIDLVQDNYQTELQAYGEIVASKTIEVRAQVAGTVVDLSPNFVTGGKVAKGELLLAIDSFAYDGALRDAQFSLADARLQLKISEEQLDLKYLNLETAQTELSFAQVDVERAKTLLAGGTVTDKTLEDRELIVTQRTQALAQIQSEIEVDLAGVERQQTVISRAEWVEEQAQRAVENTKIYAPFDGIIQSETIELGRLISTNEVLGQLYEIDTLEARFTLTDNQYGQLLEAGLDGRDVVVTWDLNQTPLKIDGQITRTSAEINAALGGVEVFAALDAEKSVSIRPGAFVEIEVEGPTYDNSFRVAETAVYENDHVYSIEEGRLSRKDISILSRDGAFLIVTGDLESGMRIMSSLLSQAGDGVRVAIEGEEVATPTRNGAGARAAGNAAAGNAAAAGAGERRLPPGAVRNEDGSVTLPNGNTRTADGRVVDADGNPVAGGRAGNRNGGAAAGGGQ